MTVTRESFYRRPLPEGLVAFAAAEGRTRFREALAAGTMEGFFALAEQFHTQADPAFCGLGSLVVALNALEIDPGRLWKGSWRWYSEELLDCCLPLEVIGSKGVTLDELGCLARCNGAEVELHRATEKGLADFRAALLRAATTPREPVLLVSYDRAALGQTGSGHFSPIGGYHPDRDLALVLDVARFKYPPHWVPVEALYQAMLTIDPETKKSRGYLLLRKSAIPGVLMFRVVRDRVAWRNLERVLREELPARYAAAAPLTAEIVLGELVAGLHRAEGPNLRAVVEELPKSTLAEYRQAIVELRQEVQATALFATLRSVLVAQKAPEASIEPFAEILTLIVLALLDALMDIWPAVAHKQLAELAGRDPLPPLLRGEIARLREQVQGLGLMQPVCCKAPAKGPERS